jgi:hypothetical protein
MVLFEVKSKVLPYIPCVWIDTMYLYLNKYWCRKQCSREFDCVSMNGAAGGDDFLKLFCIINIKKQARCSFLNSIFRKYDFNSERPIFGFPKMQPIFKCDRSSKIWNMIFHSLFLRHFFKGSVLFLSNYEVS